MSLQADEREAKQEGERQEHGQYATLARLQRVVRDCYGESTRQQDCRVDRRHPEGGDGLEGRVRQPADMRRPTGRPGALELRP